MQGSTMAGFLIHLTGAASFAFAIYYDSFVLKMPDHIVNRRESFGGLAKYLTFLNMCLQCIFFTLCLLADGLGNKSKINTVKDVIFASAAFPIGIFVAIIFWGLYAVDRELIFPAKYDGHFPDWLNHLMHTTVFPLQVAEMYFCRHEYPRRLVGGGINSLLTLLYLGWVHVVYYYGGFWVYPVFKVLSPEARPIFMAFCCALGGTFYILGEKINGALWPPSSSSDAPASAPAKRNRARKEK